VKILVIGYNPPPFQPDSKLEAANYRTWQFVQPLLEDGHELVLCVDARSPRPDAALLPAGLAWQAIAVDTIGWMPRLQEIHDRFAPDCVVAVDFYPALWATRLNTTRPIWMDLYGDPLTISQVARSRAGSDQGIGTAIALMRHPLLRGDVFSVCGVPQRDMLVGELAMCGRLNSRTLGYDFARVIYPGAPPVSPQAEQGSDTLRGLGMPTDAFVVLWCGGYNTWTDVETLYTGLATAMAGNTRMHFLSVGASTYDAAETAYDRFVASVEHSPHRSRFHLLGWRPWQEIPRLYQASDVGVNIDALHYETIYGTRTRLMEMLAYGLPVITSTGCELSYQIPKRGVGASFTSGDAAGLACALLDLSASAEQLAKMRQTARALVAGDWSFGATTAALRAWVIAPDVAPDHRRDQVPSATVRLKHALRMRARLLLWRLGLSGRRSDRLPAAGPESRWP
jgi:glycosyltransferase involved in cell wall biosynthesis